jgi:tungstate transport system substrate-binding protein
VPTARRHHGDRVGGSARARGVSAIAAAAALVAGCGGPRASGQSDSGEASSAPRGGASSSAPGGTLILGTTTSTQDSGLLDTLVPAYESVSRCRVKTVAVGSGEALAMGAKGDADVLLVHSPAAEETYMAQGHGLSRAAVMHNDFVMLGPRDDPAHAAGKTAAAAFRAIAAVRAPFASRADASGTNAKELSLWSQSGVRPSGSWYVRTGQGMGETLTIANQKQAYTLSDRGTYLATKNLDLRIISQGGAELVNRYHIIVVRHPGTNVGCARELAAWVTSAATQRQIAQFGVKRYRQPLFFPDAVKGTSP